MWEQKHRLGSFRRRAKLPAPLEKDPLTGLPLTPSHQEDPPHSRDMDQISPFPPTQYLKPTFPQPTGLGGRTTPRRFSDVGLVTSMLGQRSDMYTPMPSALSRFDRRPSASSRSGSPSRLEHEPHRFRRRSPSRYDDDELMLGSPDRIGDRGRSPSRSRMGSESDLRGKSPSPLSRRDTMTGMLSPRWPDSRTTSPRGATVFFPDSEPFPPPPPPLLPMDRRGSDFRLETVEGPQYAEDFDYPDFGEDDTHPGSDQRRDRRDSQF